MATLHRIVLAIASSWNNETSSPAPQGGNRALSNQTNALASAFAERQAQPSAKTPPIPNRIGKGIGKFWIPILLATATALSTTKVEGFTLIGLESILRHLETHRITVRAPIPAGHYLVAGRIAEKEAGANPSEKYRASVGKGTVCHITGVNWITNFFKVTTTFSHNITNHFPNSSLAGKTSPLITTASYGDEFDPSTAQGTWPNGDAMTHSEVKSALQEGRGKRIFSIYEVFSSRQQRLETINIIGYNQSDHDEDKRDRIISKRQATNDSTWDYTQQLYQAVTEWKTGNHVIGIYFFRHSSVPELNAEGATEGARSFPAFVEWRRNYYTSYGSIISSERIREIFDKNPDDGTPYFPANRSVFVEYDLIDGERVFIYNVKGIGGAARGVDAFNVEQWTLHRIKGQEPYWGKRLIRTELDVVQQNGKEPITWRLRN